MIKVAAPNMALKIIDNAIQAFGAAGVSDDAGLARDYASMRTMRLADGPDEVHNRAIARLELRKYANAPLRTNGAHKWPPKKLEGASSWPTASEETKNFRAPSPSRSGIGSTRCGSTAGMRDHVEGYQGPLTVLQFKGGQSNPTTGSIPRSLLRDAPQAVRQIAAVGACGRSRISCHRSIEQTGFPVAKAYALCTDDAVIGSAFYIMSMEEGRVFWDPMLPSQTPEARRAIFASKIETLAKLHTYDPQAIGLGDFGKPGNYFARQVDRWTKQYRASETQHIPEFEKLAEWLRRPCRNRSGFRSFMATTASTT